MRKRKWVKPFLEEKNEYLIDNALAYKDIFLEIGMGMGDFICESCKKNKDNLYIGLEKDETCVARAIKKASELNISNLKIMLKDANLLLELFNPKSVKCIYLHFSDPWPKKGHHKRRLTYKTFLSLYEKILVDDGKIVLKTDNDALFFDSIEYFKESNFYIKEINEDYHNPEKDEPKTAYERKFIAEGKPIHYALLLKK